jgi:hypothetical protein
MTKMRGLQRFSNKKKSRVVKPTLFPLENLKFDWGKNISQYTKLVKLYVIISMIPIIMIVAHMCRRSLHVFGKTRCRILCIFLNSTYSDVRWTSFSSQQDNYYIFIYHPYDNAINYKFLWTSIYPTNLSPRTVL